MSIWCSFSIIDHGEKQGAPIRYQKSHILPTNNDHRAGSLDLAYIPGFITRDGQDNNPQNETVWPYLRVNVTQHDPRGETVVLDADQAEYLRDRLTWWLEHVDKDKA